MIGKDDRSKEEPKRGSFKGYHMMRFQRLSKEGPHWWLRKLILKRRQSKTWNLTHGNVDLHRRPRRCRTKCNEGYIHPIFAKQQLNGPARGIRGSSLTFEIFQSSRWLNPASSSLVIPRHSTCPVCCLLSRHFWRLSCQKRLLSCPMWRLSCHTWLLFGQLSHFSGSLVLSGKGSSIFIWRFWR